MYARENGKHRLVALEYVLKKDWEEMHGADAHRPHLYGQRFNLTHKGNRYGIPAFYSLHAWIWEKNPRRHVRDVEPRRPLLLLPVTWSCYSTCQSLIDL